MVVRHEFLQHIDAKRLTRNKSYTREQNFTR